MRYEAARCGLDTRSATPATVPLRELSGAGGAHDPIAGLESCRSFVMHGSSERSKE